MSATKDRLVVGTTRTSHSEALRDLVAGTLDVLAHTPITAMGVNHDYVVTFTRREDFDKFGWGLVPQAPWPMLQRPGLATLLVQGERTDGEDGYVRVKVEPVLDGSFTATVGANDHFAFDERASGAVAASRILRERWYESARRSTEVLDGLFGRDRDHAR